MGGGWQTPQGPHCRAWGYSLGLVRGYRLVQVRGSRWGQGRGCRQGQGKGCRGWDCNWPLGMGCR